MWAARFISEEGGKIIGVSEWDGSIYAPEGIHVEDLIKYKTVKGGVKGFPGC